MNNIIRGTDFERELVFWKIQRGIYNNDPEVPLVGWKWWKLFKRRNPEIVSKAGKKFSRNRSDHCLDTPFQKMYNKKKDLLIASGNAERFNESFHMDITGKIVDDKAHAFGWPVIIKYTCPCNVFFMDDTRDNTHGKDGSIKGGEKKVVPAGEVLREEIGANNAHSTVAPFNDSTGQLQCVVVVFPAEKLNP